MLFAAKGEVELPVLLEASFQFLGSEETVFSYSLEWGQRWLRGGKELWAVLAHRCLGSFPSHAAGIGAAFCVQIPTWLWQLSELSKVCLLINASARRAFLAYVEFNQTGLAIILSISICMELFLSQSSYCISSHQTQTIRCRIRIQMAVYP